jgi:hypothetical protein
MKSADLLPVSIWREQLKRLAYWVVMAVFGLMWLALVSAIASCA